MVDGSVSIRGLINSHRIECMAVAGLMDFSISNMVQSGYCCSIPKIILIPLAFCFTVDASAAGEGQLEISINEGEVPNHVQVVGGGRCLVSFTPEQAKPHYIDIKFNGETVNGCPFVCSVADTSRVLLNLSNLGKCTVNIRHDAFYN